MDPGTVESLYWWQFKALLGFDEPEDSPNARARTLSVAEAQTRRDMAARADRLRQMSESDPDAVAERLARNASRESRRAQQRSDPAWREEVKANRNRPKTPDPSRVVQTDDSETDILIVR